MSLQNKILLFSFLLCFLFDMLVDLRESSLHRGGEGQNVHKIIFSNPCDQGCKLFLLLLFFHIIVDIDP